MLPNAQPQKTEKDKRETATADPHIVGFFEWLQKYKVQHSSLKIEEFEDGLRGVCSERPLKQGEKLVQIPSELIIVPKNLKHDHPIKQILDDLVPDPWSGLVVLLMYEMANPNSFFVPW